MAGPFVLVEVPWCGEDVEVVDDVRSFSNVPFGYVFTFTKGAHLLGYEYSGPVVLVFNSRWNNRGGLIVVSVVDSLYRRWCRVSCMRHGLRCVRVGLRRLVRVEWVGVSTPSGR